MTRAGQSGRFRSQQPACRIAVACFELIKSCPQSLEVRSTACVNDVEIERGDRRTADHRRHPADHDQLDVVPGEDFKGVFESGRIAQGRAR